MLEIPESTTIARQLNETVSGRSVVNVVAAHSPHKFAFFHENPEDYKELLSGLVIGESLGIGAMIEISAGSRRIVLGDGANLRYYNDSTKLPSKHQLLLEFDDKSVLLCSVQMYGTVLAFKEGTIDNKYYFIAKEKTSPLDDSFDIGYFTSLRLKETDKLSAKAFLATQQRIPGLGNGILQDILFHAGVHPKRKMGTITPKEYISLFHSVKDTISEMTRMGGRDTEKGLFGKTGGYLTILSKNTVGKSCPVCGAVIQKTSYLGGAIYWCPVCQPLQDNT